MKGSFAGPLVCARCELQVGYETQYGPKGDVTFLLPGRCSHAPSQPSRRLTDGLVARRRSRRIAVGGAEPDPARRVRTPTGRGEGGAGGGASGGGSWGCLASLAVAEERGRDREQKARCRVVRSGNGLFGLANTSARMLSCATCYGRCESRVVRRSRSRPSPRRRSARASASESRAGRLPFVPADSNPYGLSQPAVSHSHSFSSIDNYLSALSDSPRTSSSAPAFSRAQARPPLGQARSPTYPHCSTRPRTALSLKSRAKDRAKWRQSSSGARSR